MKGKLALLALLSTIVTVGGVYATWTFAEGNTTAANTTVNVAMTGVNAETEKGTLSVTVMNNGGFTLAVDDANNDHLPDILKTGVITVTFTPSASASDAIKENGIDVKCVFSYKAKDGAANAPASLEAWTYEGTQIFNIENTEANPIHLDNEDASYANGVFTWTIDPEDVGIDLTAAMKDVSIDTLAKYNALNAELGKGSFLVTVSECSDHA